ncbi:MAG: hypothetical protein ACRDQY_06775 [Pseudonocardiaceae bacterium]
MSDGDGPQRSINDVCPDPVSPDEQRRRRAEQTRGTPWMEYPRGNTPYVEYARMDTLLELQHPRTGLTTECEFIVLSQIKELLFTLLHRQLTEAAIEIRDGRIAQAL